MKNKKRYFITMLVLIVLDQTIKQVVFNKLYTKIQFVIIKNILSITYVENTGGAYGIGNNNILFIIISNLIIIATIIFIILSKKYNLTNKEYFGLTLILAGGTSNFLDRIFRGYVIDYIDINELISFPMFNLADICVVIGVLFILIINLIEMGEEAK